VLERAMQAELSPYLGYSKHGPKGNNSGNSRNGKSQKTLKGDFGSSPLEVPRDRDSTFEPQIVPKGQTRFDGFDDKILSLYARGMTTCQIKQHLEEIYQVEVSPSLISSVTDAISDEVKAWQSRPLDAIYPIIYLDALVVKVRESSHIQNKAIHLIIGINTSGRKEVLGLWVRHNEGASSGCKC
jgi:putative transposase